MKRENLNPSIAPGFQDSVPAYSISGKINVFVFLFLSEILSLIYVFYLSRLLFFSSDT
jgi:hypothetical protein